jgi:16S rRNA (uracil1498-N3)-methyltransferase
MNFGVLNEDESGHAIRVLRLAEDDHITIVNGKGRSAVAKITSTSKKEVGFEIINEIDNEAHPLHLHIGIGPTKSIDRFSFFLEKATEMGVQEVTPILSTNSERKILKEEKLRKGMVSALKQSGNLFLPVLNDMSILKDFITQDFGSAKKFIAHCNEDVEKIDLKDQINSEENIVILIGPEGDFTHEEIKFAKENGFKTITLGNSRLRTETAGILACHTVYLSSY